ncbi:MAG TPA: hypothetical protein VGL53_20590 [Bryobacteraceae bacterium]|jgi:hypothetical protein
MERNGGLSWIVEVIVVGVILAAIVGITSLGSRALIQRAKHHGGEARPNTPTREIRHQRVGSGLVKTAPHER